MGTAIDSAPFFPDLGDSDPLTSGTDRFDSGSPDSGCLDAGGFDLDSEDMGLRADLDAVQLDVGRPETGPPGPELNWLFLDLNSYFASVEQEVRPELRNRPVGVVPMVTDTTVCIAASYEAKAYGVKTGTSVADAKQMCPDIVFVEGRHEIHTDYHHRVVKAVESCLPVTAVLSIDEMACRLIGRERPLLAAMELGQRVKTAIREKVGPC